MVKAIGTAFVGVGLTITSTFAPSLGLSIHAQRIGFGIGAFLILFGAYLVFHQWRKKPSTAPPQPKERIGLDNEATGTANLRNVRFGEKLDRSIRNRGKLDVDDSDVIDDSDVK